MDSKKQIVSMETIQGCVGRYVEERGAGRIGHMIQTIRGRELKRNDGRTNGSQSYCSQLEVDINTGLLPRLQASRKSCRAIKKTRISTCRLRYLLPRCFYLLVLKARKRTPGPFDPRGLLRTSLFRQERWPSKYLICSSHSCRLRQESTHSTMRSK